MTEQSQPDKTVQRQRYFLASYVFLFLLALLWSVCDAFVYFFLGGAAICLYLGIRTYVPQVNSNVVYPKINFRQRVEDNTGSTVGQATGQKTKIPRIVAVVIGFMIFSVFLSVFVAVFSDDEDYEFNYQIGNSYYEAGKYDSAIIFFRQAISQNPEFADALIGYGNAKLALIQNDSAIMFYDKALALDVENPQARYQKGRALYFNKNYEQCIPILEELVASDSGNNEAIQLIGDSFYNQQKYDSALTWYENAYSTGYRNTYLCYLMGYIYETKNKNDRAVELYKEAIGFDDTIADLYARLGALVPGPDGDVYRAKATALETESKH